MRKDDHLIYESLVQSRTPVSEENAQGLSDQEYHKARKDAYEGAGEELGHGPIKVQLKRDTTMDCYKAGTVQGVRFAKGTIFNCDVNVGDYYECDTEEYGGVAVFPDDVTVLSGEENAESADAKKERTQKQWQMNKNRWAKWKMENPEAAARHAAKKMGKEENAEHVDGITKRRGELAGNIMDIVRYGIPTKQEFIKIRQELHYKTKEILDRGTPATEEERARGRQLIGMIRSYRAQHPNDPPVVRDLHHAEVSAEENAEDASDNIRMKLAQAHGIVKGLIEMIDKTPAAQTPYNEMAITHLVNLQEDLKELSMMLQDRMLGK